MLDKLNVNIRKEEKIKRMKRLNDLFMKDRSILVLEELEILTENSGVAAEKLDEMRD